MQDDLRSPLWKIVNDPLLGSTYRLRTAGLEGKGAAKPDRLSLTPGTPHMVEGENSLSPIVL